MTAEDDATYYLRLKWENDFATARDIGMAEPAAYADASLEAKRAMLETHSVMRRIGEHGKELLAWVGGRPILVARDQTTVNRSALRHADIEQWFLQRGIVCRVRIESGGRIGFDSAWFLKT